MLTKNEICKHATINPKAQAIFVHTIVNVIFQYMLQVKNTKNLFNNNFGVLSHIKIHYGCYEIVKNGSLHIHTILWLNDYPNPKTLVQTLHDDKIFRQNMINYLNDIITQDINQYKSCSIMTYTKCIDDNLDNIHPRTTRHQILKKNRYKLFQNDIHKLMNICNRHVCNPTCYKTYVIMLKNYAYIDSLNF